MLRRSDVNYLGIELRKKNGSPALGKVPKVIIPQRAMEGIERLAWNATARGIETGGNFFGNLEADNIYKIVMATGPGDESQQSPGSFVADKKHAQQRLDSLREVSELYWIGSWHVHPRNYDRLSSTDINSMMKIVEDPECLDYYIAMVLSACDSKMKVRCFLFRNGADEIIEMNVLLKKVEEIGKIPESRKNYTIPLQTNIKEMLVHKGLYDIGLSEEDEHIIIEAKHNDQDILLIIPIKTKESPILFVEQRLTFVPINWNSLCTLKDFIKAINLES
jgi:integrative and conjugative element protein (TIGR02256 family)